MGWFDEQVRTRLENDRYALQDSYEGLASVLTGRKRRYAAQAKAEDALEEICSCYRVQQAKIPSSIQDLNEQIEYALRPAGVLRRRVRLEGAWWKDGVGPLLCETQDGAVAALIPRASGGYRFTNRQTGRYEKVTRESQRIFKEEAICFYRPLPQRPLTLRDLVLHLLRALSPYDWLGIAGASLFSVLLGMLTPLVNQILFADILPARDGSLVMSVALLLLGASVSIFLMDITRSLIKSRFQTKLDVALDSAVIGRVINLPAGFFKARSAGELSERIHHLSKLCELICEAGLGIALPSLFSLAYLGQIAGLSPALAAPAALVLLVQLGVAAAAMALRTRLIRRQMESQRKVGGIVFALFSGIQKIKLCGSEKRAFANWAALYGKQARFIYNPPLFLKVEAALSAVIALAGTALLYLSAAKSGVTPAQYMAFSAAYGLLSGAALRLTGAAGILSFIAPILESAKPILEAAPETTENKRSLESISGGIELNNVSFRYDENGPLILNDVSLKIRKGQYVAIVGRTGCGKSTLLRLLLGFEKPQTGAIYYDNADIQTVDLKSLRRNIGVVLQNGRLFTGDIYSNITISAPWLTMDEAWEAARLAGMEEDIRNMPMGMRTVLSEGSGGISGGQRQRLMIARAIAPKPRVLMMDEATSALDNLTQKQVSDALGAIKSTRVVIAHRLSTIRQCDRILVLEGGRIIEDGSYEELCAQNGFFADLVRRQQIDAETA